MEVIKKRIAKKDVAKVMREVGYNKKNIDSKSGSNIEDQLAIANENAKGAPTMADAINRAVANVSPPPTTPIVLPPGEPKVGAVTPDPVEEVPKGSKSKAVKKLKEKHKEPEKPSQVKKVTIDMTTLKTKVTFVGKGWKPLDIKIANNELIKAFRIKIRDEYRKGIK